MYLCEQLGILTLDMPDSFAFEYNKEARINTEIRNETPTQQTHFITFTNGGPVRIFMHILLSCMYNTKASAENFTNAIAMLRFMVLRDRSEQFSAVIQRVIGDLGKIENPIKVFNMFNRIG